MTRVLHYGKNGLKKYVTSLVRRRVLYELVPSKRREDGIEVLASFFQIRRSERKKKRASGVKSKQTQNGSVYALVEASSDELEKKPLAKCTATQLGHYFGLLWSKREGTTTLERSSEDGETSWADLTIKQLKPELRKRGLKLSGRKDELIKRLEDYDDQVKLPSSDPLSVSS